MKITERWESPYGHINLSSKTGILYVTLMDTPCDSEHFQDVIVTSYDNGVCKAAGTRIRYARLYEASRVDPNKFAHPEKLFKMRPATRKRPAQEVVVSGDHELKQRIPEVFTGQALHLRLAPQEDYLLDIPVETSDHDQKRYWFG